MHPLALIALAPVLLVQGKYVRGTIVRLPEPEGPRAGRIGTGAPLRLLVTGDSSAAGVGASRQEHALAARLAAALAPRFDVDWVCHARSGIDTREALAELDALPPQPFDVAIVVLGVNDVTGGTSQRKFETAQRRLIEVLRERHGAPQIVLSGLPPVHSFPALPQPLRAYLGGRARRFDGVLADLARETPGVMHEPLEIGETLDLVASDGFHPGEPAYALWALALAERITLSREPPTP